MCAATTPRPERSPRSSRPSAATSGAHEPKPRERLAEVRRRANEVSRHRQTLLGGVSVGLFLIGGGGGLWYWHVTEAAAEASRQQLAEAQQALRTEVDALDLDNATQAERVVRRLEATQEQWRTWPTAGHFAELRTKAQAALVAARAAGALQDEVHQLEQLLAAPPTDLAVWATMRERGRRLKEATKNVPVAVQQQVRSCVDRVADGYLTALRAAVNTNPDADPKATLANLETAETLTAELLAAADLTHDRADHDRRAAELSGFVRLEDDLVGKVFDATRIAASPWQDLLPGTRTADWLHSATGGLEHAVQGDTLRVEAKDAGDKRSGVVTLSGHPLRHCLVEFDVTLTGGSATILVRADKRAQATNAAAVKLVLVTTPNAVQVPEAVPVHVEMRVIGSDLVVQAKDTKLASKVPGSARCGGFAVIVTTGTTLSLSHLRVKQLT